MKQLYILVTIGIMVSCGKEKQKTETGLISGRAFFKNRFATDSGTLKPLALQDVFVRNSNDIDDNYFFKTKTDRDGNFYIDITTRPIVIFVKTTANIDANNSAIFYDQTEVSSTGPANLQLIAELDTSKQNGFLLSLKDESGDVVSNTTVYLYNSQALAVQNNPAGAVATLPSDIYGKIFKVNLPAGNYYLNATKTIDTVVYLRFLKQITIQATGLVQDTMLLKKDQCEWVHYCR